MSTLVSREYGLVKWRSLTSNSTAGRIVLAIAATGLMALAAHVTVPLPFTPVPLVLTPFAVLLIGMLLGPGTAFFTMVLYLAEGAAGAPVFAPSGTGGLAQLLGPTGGFLVAYPLVAATAGWIVRRFSVVSSAIVRALGAGAVATAILFLSGAGWLSTLLHLSAGSAWHMAVAPFLPGECLKIVAAATLYSSTQRWQRS